MDFRFDIRHHERVTIIIDHQHGFSFDIRHHGAHSGHVYSGEQIRLLVTSRICLVHVHAPGLTFQAEWSGGATTKSANGEVIPSLYVLSGAYTSSWIDVHAQSGDHFQGAPLWIFV